MNTYIVKIFYKKEIRRYAESTRSYPELVRKIKKLFFINSSFSIHYWDEDKDYVKIHNSDSLVEAVRQYAETLKTFKLYVHDINSPEEKLEERRTRTVDAMVTNVGNLLQGLEGVVLQVSELIEDKIGSAFYHDEEDEHDQDKPSY